MRLYNQNCYLTIVALTLSLILCNNQLILVQSQSGGSAAVSGSLSIGGGSGGISASAAGSAGSGGSSSAGSAAGSSQSNGGGGSSSASASGSSSSQSGGGMSASGAASLDMGGGSSSSAAASASSGSTTPKPKGLLTKVKDILKEGKEILTGDQKSNGEASAGAASGSKDGSSAGAASTSLSIGTSGGSGNGTSASAAAAAAASSSSSGSGSGSSSASSSASASASLSVGSTSKPDDGKKGGIMDKVEKTVGKGTEMVKDTIHKIEDKAHDIEDKVTKAVDDNIFKPMQSVGGSGTPPPEGSATAHAQAAASLKGSDREKYLNELKIKQENEISKPTKIKDILQDAKRKGIIPQNEDRSALKGNHADEKSVVVEVFDKAHEMSKYPVEQVLRPIDKMLGYEKDPLLRIYDDVHEVIRKPLGVLSKPVESVLQGAFKTTDEAKKEQEKLLATKSEQERREYRIKEEKIRKEDRSVVGSIADKSVELATKPIEIVLRPIDHFFGYDKPGKKNPFLKLFDMVYSLSKKPVDAVAKPFERILKKMGEEDRAYQVSIRYQNEKDNADPRLVSRLADGALNIADRVLTKPLEIFMRPMDKALGYDDPGKKNPLIEAAHSLKNATKVGVELFTKPIDRIIKEIIDVQRPKTEAELKAYREHQKEIASRLVKVMDKTKNVAQLPFEIVLRPVSKILGTNKEGKRGPLLRAWDYIHSIIRAPVQVISKPIEDALLGEQQDRNKKQQGGIKVEAKIGASSSASASASSSSSSSSSSGSSKAKANASADSNSGGGNSKAKASASLSMSSGGKN